MAAGDVYLIRGVTRTWEASGEEELDFNAAAAGAAVVGSYHQYRNPVTAAAPDEYEVVVSHAGHQSDVSGQSIDCYFVESPDMTIWSGQEIPADATDGAASTTALPNHKYVGSVIARAAGTEVGIFRVPSQAVGIAPLMHNNTTGITNAAGFKLTITPLYYQSQSA